MADSFKFVPKAPENIVLTILNKNSGCSKTLTIPVYVSPVSITYPSSTACSGVAVKLHAKTGTSYRWSPSLGLSDTTIQDPIANPATTSSYTVLIKDSGSGCYRSDFVTVVVDSGCVWPGDADRDHYANFLDVLQLGLGYGQTGPPRVPDSTDWNHYGAPNWAQKTPLGINYKNLDFNGDGVIDAKDTNVINKNYIYKKYPEKNVSGAPIYFKFATDTFYSGDTA